MKIRKIKHRFGKFFGSSNEKWAKGGGKLGYGAGYGRNKYGKNYAVDCRNKYELQNSYDINHIDDMISGDY
jgi:hypothetical protein